jgi:hypothetical protein
LEHLKALELLDLQNNEVASFHALVPLRSLPKLTRITIDRNPLTTRSDGGFSLPRLVALLPTLQRVNGTRVSGEIRAKAAAYEKGWVESVVAGYQRRVFDDAMKTPAPAAPLGLFLASYLAERESGALALDPLARRGAAALQKRGGESQIYSSLALAARERYVRTAYAAGTLPVVRDEHTHSSCTSCLLAGPQLLHACIRLDSILNHELEQRDGSEVQGSSTHHTPRSRSSQSLPATPLRNATHQDISSATSSFESERPHLPAPMQLPRAALPSRSLHRRLNSAQIDDEKEEEAAKLMRQSRPRAHFRLDSLPAFELAVIASSEPVAT